MSKYSHLDNIGHPPPQKNNTRQHTTKHYTPEERHTAESETAQRNTNTNQIRPFTFTRKNAGWHRGKYSDENHIEATTYRRKLWIVPRKNLTMEDLQEFRAFRVEPADVGSGVRERGVSGMWSSASHTKTGTVFPELGLLPPAVHPALLFRAG